MSEYPFFSVVIPTYNRAGFIEATLQSVLTQTYHHYEVIVVDDCSTDNTEELLQPYILSGKLTFIKQDQNLERAHSRNVGMNAAQGDFVTLLDSDDFMYSTNLADAADYARSHPEIKCFHNLYEFVDSERNVLRRQVLPPLENQLRAIASGNFMACIGDFIHREIYEHYKFDVTLELIGGEDWEFWLRVLADHKVGRIEKINSGILDHGGRSVNNHSIDSVKRGLEHLCMKIETEAHVAQVYRPYLKRMRASSFLYLAILANTSGRFPEAREFLKRAIRIDFSLLRDSRLWRVARRALFRLQP